MKLSIILWVVKHLCVPYSSIGDYMARSYLIRERSWLPFAVRIHHIKRSDAGRDLHNHPWWYITIILRGGYIEWTPTDEPGARGWAWKGAGSISFHGRDFKHRLDVLKKTDGAWTLFIHGRRSGPNRWGFFTARGYVPHSQYLKEV